MNIANKLTILRILIVPVMLFFILSDIRGGDLIAASLFFIAAMTDIMDGYLARKYNLVTDFGKVFDPIADKILVLAALIPLCMTGDMIITISTIIIVSREMLISGLRISITAHGAEVPAAKILGKIKAITQDVAIIFFFTKSIWGFIPLPLDYIILLISVFFTVWSVIDYYVKGFKYLDMEKI